VAFASRADWRAWLAANHDAARGLWLKIAKAGSGNGSVTYPEALDVALCYGWIDGQKAAYDEAWWLQRLTPRGPRSKWSKINCGKAEALIASGRCSRPASPRSSGPGPTAAGPRRTSRSAAPPSPTT